MALNERCVGTAGVPVTERIGTNAWAVFRRTLCFGNGGESFAGTLFRTEVPDSLNKWAEFCERWPSENAFCVLFGGVPQSREDGVGMDVAVGGYRV
jgi:hypothetical protein